MHTYYIHSILSLHIYAWKGFLCMTIGINLGTHGKTKWNTPLKTLDPPLQLFLYPGVGANYGWIKGKCVLTFVM